MINHEVERTTTVVAIIIIDLCCLLNKVCLMEIFRWVVLKND